MKNALLALVKVADFLKFRQIFGATNVSAKGGGPGGTRGGPGGTPLAKKSANSFWPATKQ